MPSIIAKTRVEFENLLWDRELHLRHMVAQHLGIDISGTDYDVVTHRSDRTGNKPWLCVEIDLSEGPLGHINMPWDMPKLYTLGHRIKESLNKRPGFAENGRIDVDIKPALCGIYITSEDSEKTIAEEKEAISRYLNSKLGIVYHWDQPPPGE